jgi:hypothetical protein
MTRAPRNLFKRLIGGGLAAAESVPCLPPGRRQGRAAIAAGALVVAVAAGMPPAGAAGDARLDTAVTITQAMLLAQKCGAVAPDEATANETLRRQGLTWADISEGGTYWPAVQVAAGNARKDLAAYSSDTACNAARKLFGPAGEAIPGLVVDK